MLRRPCHLSLLFDGPKKGIVSNESLARSNIQELAGVSVIHQSTITKLAVAINIKTLAWEKQASFSW